MKHPFVFKGKEWTMEQVDADGTLFYYRVERVDGLYAVLPIDGTEWNEFSAVVKQMNKLFK